MSHAMTSAPLPDDPVESARSWARHRQAMRWMLGGMVLLVSLAWRMIRHGGGLGAIRLVILAALGLGMVMLLASARLGMRVILGRNKGREGVEAE